MRHLWLLLFLLFACKNPESTEVLEYTGPLREMEQVELFFSERNLLKVKMKAAKLFEYANGDREFPEGVYLEFYNEQGAISSAIKANHAYYTRKEEEWRGWENVEVRNFISQEQLNTEELFWKPDKKTIRTDKFVTIRKQDNVIYGTGLDAAEDLSDYEIREIRADLNLEDQ